MEVERNKYNYDVQFEVPTAMTAKSAVFCFVTLCNSDRIRRFEGTFASVFRVEDLAKQEINRTRLAQATSPNHTALQSVFFKYSCVHVSSPECSTES